MDGLWARGENETPNPKHQAPEKSQTSNSKTCRRLAALELGTWSFIGVWCLVFGALIGGRNFPSPPPSPHSFVAGGGRRHCVATALLVLLFVLPIVSYPCRRF